MTRNKAIAINSVHEKDPLQWKVVYDQIINSMTFSMASFLAYIT